MERLDECVCVCDINQECWCIKEMKLRAFFFDSFDWYFFVEIRVPFYVDLKRINWWTNTQTHNDS